MMHIITYHTGQVTSPNKYTTYKTMRRSVKTLVTLLAACYMLLCTVSLYRSPLQYSTTALVIPLVFELLADCSH
jgi:hypothetical protein